MRGHPEEALRSYDESPALRRHVAHLEMQLRTIEAETRQLTVRWQGIARKNAALTNLYVAVHQLHGTLVRAEVVEALLEIVVGLIGSEAVAVFERVDDGAFHVIASIGAGADDVSADDSLGRLLASGVRYVAGEPHALAGELAMPVAAALPLCIDGRVTGGIVIFSLLAQKSGFDDIDYELFDVLSTHAALALHRTSALGAEVTA